MSALTLETLDKKIDSMTDSVTKFIANYNAMDDKNHTDKEKEKETAMKKAMDEEKKVEEEKKEAKRAVRDAALKIAMEEEDPEKKEAAIKKAMSDYDEHPSKKNEAMTDEEKENKANVAAILGDKKIEIDNKILHVAQFTNPNGIKALKEVLASNTFIASKKMLDDLALTYGAAIFENNSNNLTNQQQHNTPAPFFMGGVITPAEVDSNLLTASSSLSEFAKLDTKKLMKGDNS